MIDTQHETLSPLPPPLPDTVVVPAGRQRWWARPLAALALGLLLTIVVTSLLPASLTAEKLVPSEEDPSVDVYEPTPFAIVPASAEPADTLMSFGQLEGVVEVDEDRAGHVYYVTVRDPAQSVLSSWIGHPEPEIVPLTDFERNGRVTPTQRRNLSLQMMRTSSQVAQYVALRKLGFEEAQLVAGNVVVEDLVCLEPGEEECAELAPAAESLEPGDTIVSIDGVSLDTVEDLVAELEDNEPGDVVTLEIERGERGGMTVQVPLTASPEEPERTIVGIVPFDTATVELPFEIDIDTRGVGGPSAGLAFTLTLIDELSEGDLLGGRNVAATGEIDLEGNVGAIGGLPQKVSAVKQVGVEHLLVPASQSDESLRQAQVIAGDDVEIIPVATLDEALTALRRLGGDELVIHPR